MYDPLNYENPTMNGNSNSPQNSIMLPASTALNGRLRANIMTVKKMGLITVSAVVQPYLAVRTSLIQGQAGHLSRCLFMMQLWAQSQIAAFLWFAQKYIATSVRLI